MLCMLCQHGVNSKQTWKCLCGETSCRHVRTCNSCGMRLVSKSLGLYSRVSFGSSYVVEAENPEMEEVAKAAVIQNVKVLAKLYGEDLRNSIVVEDAPGATREDIPDFLLKRAEDIYGR